MAEEVDRMFRTRYSHLANPEGMRGQMEMAVVNKRSMFQEVVRNENKRLLTTLADYFGGIQLAIDRVGDVLSVQYGVNLKHVHPEERRRMVHEQVGKMAEKRRREGVDERLPPNNINKHSNMEQSARFLEDMSSSELGRRMLEQQRGEDRSYTPRWGDEGGDYMEQSYGR